MNKAPNNILYIDDDVDDLYIFTETIEAQFPQYRICQAQNGEEGLALLSTLPAAPCLIILDMNMPRMDGKQTLQSIRGNPHWAAIPIVVFTTSASQADIAFGEAHKAEIMTKPMGYDDLNQTVQRLVAYCESQKV